MSAGRDGKTGRRAARWVAPAVLCAGGIGVLAGAAWLYVGPELDVLRSATWTEAGPPVVVKNLGLAALAVLGTILVSIGIVFALDPAGVLAAAAGPRHDRLRRAMEESGSQRHAAPSTGSDPTQVPTPIPGVAGPAGTAASGLRGADDGPVPRTGSAPDQGTPDAAPTRGGGEAIPARMTDAAPETTDEPESASPAPETAVPARAVEEPPPPEEPQPNDLLAAWDDYRRDGDGHFNRRGLQGVLDHRGLAANVSGGERVDAGGAVLIVETPSGAPDFYVLPSFNKSPRAVAYWFDDSSDGALTGRTQRVTRLARGRWMETGAGTSSRNFEVLGRGEVA